MLGPLSCIVGHIHPHLTFMQPAEGGSPPGATPLIKYPRFIQRTRTMMSSNCVTTALLAIAFHTASDPQPRNHEYHRTIVVASSAVAHMHVESLQTDGLYSRQHLI